jgi:ABC-type glycerol-3-phosphate transport system permease component
MIPPNWAAELTWNNYLSIFNKGTYGKYFLNSLFIALASTVLSILLGAMASYWIARITRKPIQSG